jgi:hypothetical protein
VACSYKLPLGHTYQHTSFIAVGAPEYDSGRGAVYIYHPDNPNTPVQVISAPPGAPADSNFGASVAFIEDENGDGIDELVIGQPYESVMNAGLVHGYRSSNGGATPYVSVGATLSGVVGYGSRIIGLRNDEEAASLVANANFVVANPDTGEILGGYMFCVSETFCNLFSSGLFNESSNLGFGHALAEISEQGGRGRIAVVSPLDPPGSDKAYTVDETGLRVAIPNSVAHTNLVWSVGGSIAGGYLALSYPTLGKIYLHSSSVLTNLCSVSLPMSSVPNTAYQSLVDQEGIFNGLFSELGAMPDDTTFASFRDESSTGGSIGIMGAGGGASACYGVKQVNNCVNDTNQQQGHTVVGGVSCIGRQSSPSGMLVSASPGYNGGMGRVDIYYAADRLDSAQGCVTATPTATPTVAPTDPPASSTSVPDGAGRVIAVQPGMEGLPAPTISKGAKGSVTLTAPSAVKSTLLVDSLKRLLRLNQKAAEKAAKSASFSYEFRVSRISIVSSSMGALSVNAMAKSLSDQKRVARKIAYISRRNQITLRNLAPGTYVASYRVRISIKGANRTLFTKFSQAAKFSIAGG